MLSLSRIGRAVKIDKEPVQAEPFDTPADHSELVEEGGWRAQDMPVEARP